MLYGNNPRSLTRRLQAKLNPRADRIKEETACTRASPTHFPRSTAAPEGAWKTDPKWVDVGIAAAVLGVVFDILLRG